LRRAATALYQRAEKPAEGDKFGAALAKAAETEVVWVWPENWPAWQLFNRIDTQWRVGPKGATGLDYNVLLRFLDRMRLSDDDYEQMLNDISVIEQSALAAIHREAP
jgi:hypothetical protein